MGEMTPLMPQWTDEDSLCEQRPHTVLGKKQYSAIQAGLLTPLTFARHRLSPFAAFTSGVYFLHTGRR